MPLPRPSIVIKAFLAPEICTEVMEKEFKRSYMIIAQSIVSPLPEDALDQGNVIRLCVRMYRPYWDASDPSAQELWAGSVRDWLINLVRNLNNTLKTYNRVLHPAGAGNIDFAFAELEFGENVVVRFALEDNQLPGDAAAMVDDLRALMAEGAFGEGEVETVAIPSAESLAARQAALEEAQAAAEAAASEEDAESGEGEAVVSEIPLDLGAWGISFADGTPVEYRYR